MNFGYPNTPYASNMTQEGYMGNVGVNPSMDYMQPQTMPYGMGMGGCGQPGCNQVVQQMATIDMPYYVNYNTHAVSNLYYIKRSKNAKKVPKSVQNGVFLDKNCNFSPFTSSVLN